MYIVTSQKHVICTLMCRPTNRGASLVCMHSEAAAALFVAKLLMMLQQQQFCCLQLLVIVCRTAKLVAGSVNLMPALSFSLFRPDLSSMNPLQSYVAFTGSIFIYHPELRARTKPRRV